jgi:hypothetical protein
MFGLNPGRIGNIGITWFVSARFPSIETAWRDMGIVWCFEWEIPTRTIEEAL